MSCYTPVERACLMNTNTRINGYTSRRFGQASSNGRKRLVFSPRRSVGVKPKVKAKAVGPVRVFKTYLD